jgi:hypothetical protein
MVSAKRPSMFSTDTRLPGKASSIAAPSKSLAPIKLTDLMRFGHNWEPKVMSVLAGLAIPPERYAECPPLQR